MSPKPYKFIGFGAMDVTKPYEFIGFGAGGSRMDSGSGRKSSMFDEFRTDPSAPSEAR